MFPRFDNLNQSQFEHNVALLATFSVSDPAEATRCLTQLADEYRTTSMGRNFLQQGRPESFDPLDSEPQWFRSLKRILQEAPAPDAILQSLVQYVARSQDLDSVFSLFESTPRSLEILARLSCSSSYLSQILINEPDSLSSLARERRTAEMKAREDFRDAALKCIQPITDRSKQLDALRAFQRREILRIGMCDAFGLLDLKFVTLQISLLADALVQVCLNLVCEDLNLKQPPFSVIALGKLGGEELNYSSDIDLVLIASENSSIAQRAARQMITLLSQAGATGFLYRVDMRLRPWGDAGPLVSDPETYIHYLANDAELWEKQALLKARLIAGDLDPGTKFLKQLPELLHSENETEVLDSIRRIKSFIEDRLRKAGRLNTEVKLGAGSIRDVEFMVQALQLLHGDSKPYVYSANTLDALVRLAEYGILNAFEYRQLREGYIFLRTIEHVLQLDHNLQIHQLPESEKHLDVLARRLDYANQSDLMQRFDEHRRAIRRTFQQFFGRSVNKNTSIEEDSDASAFLQESSAEGNTKQPVFTTRRILSEYLQKPVDELQAEVDDLLADLSPLNCCQVIFEPLPAEQNRILVKIVGFQTPEVLSMICGCLVDRNLDIREAAIATADDLSIFHFRLPPGHFAGFFVVESLLPEGLFENSEVPARIFSLSNHRKLSVGVQTVLSRMMMDLREGHGQQMREELVEIICRRIKETRHNDATQADLKIHFQQSAPDEPTVLEIHADDSPGFFLELSGALALFGYRIQSAELGAAEGRILDNLKITDSDGHPIATESRRDQLVAAVTIVKQFTHWLPNNSDPLNALLRFRDLLKTLFARPARRSDVARLNQPTILRDVSHVLGLSRYLWEDFLMVRSKDFLDFMHDRERLESPITREEIQQELDQILKERIGPDAVDALNRFKDRHLFRIDLRHVLGLCRPFGQFSAEITELADVIVSRAAELAFAGIRDQHGIPMSPDGQACRYCIAALGKFGGTEMGFASDLEVYVVYQQDGQTNGDRPISNASFFERLVNQLTETIHARHKGIFEIDLRMRPHGQAGSAAVTLETFRTYYDQNGDCWPYERQSLVKLRPVGGDADFHEQLRQSRDDLIYVGEIFDFDAMRAFREQQVRQLVRAGTINAKLSYGGLVDCEYAVQALQITFGDQYPKLRSPNTLKALQAAHSSQLLTEQQYLTIESAYRFLREAIDCLRMVRGHAMDLTVPEPATPDFIQLARRMEKVHDSHIPLEQLDVQMQKVQEFAADIFRICTEGRDPSLTT